MDKLNKLLRGWSGRQEPGREHIDSLAGKISRSVEGIKPRDERKREPAAPLRVKLGYALSGALVTALVFLVFVDGRGPEDIVEMIAEEPEISRDMALRSVAEPARRRREFVYESAAPPAEIPPTAAQEIFPRPGHLYDERFSSLEIPARRLAGHGWGPIENDVVRIVSQPLGISGRGYEVNLKTSRVTAYPGTYEKEEPWIFRLSEEGREKFLALVKSGDFFDIPHRDERVGFDGAWYFIEADISGRYHWILHWQPEQEKLLEIFRVVENEAEVAERRLRRDE